MSVFTSEDYDKFRALRVTHIAARFEELISDEANDAVTPEQLFLTAVDDAMDARTAGKIDKLIKGIGQGNIWEEFLRLGLRLTTAKV